jgi:hypothetical protein
MTLAPSTKPLPGQYDYASFQEVLRWIRHLVDVHGPRMAVAFERYIRLRSYYSEEKKDPEAAHIIECIIKNDVGVRRLREDFPEMFQEVSNIGRQVEFHEGRFLGWGGEVSYNPELKAVCAYEI